MSTPSKNAIELLKADHREVDKMFEQFQSARGRSQRKKLVRQIATALNAHTIIEEEIFYPACSQHGIEEDDLDEAQVEHDTIKLLLRELIDGNLDDDYYDAKMTVVSEYVKHHVEEEEEPKDGIFARLEKTDADLDELGQELKARKDELMEDPERLTQRPPRIRSLTLGRDSRAGGSRQAENRDDRDRYFDARGDERSHVDARGDERPHVDRRYQEHSGYPDQQGERGWHGDPRGHAEAARRGWRNRDH